MFVQPNYDFLNLMFVPVLNSWYYFKLNVKSDSYSLCRRSAALPYPKHERRRMPAPSLCIYNIQRAPSEEPPPQKRGHLYRSMCWEQPHFRHSPRRYTGGRDSPCFVDLVEWGPKTDLLSSFSNVNCHKKCGLHTF